MSARRPAWSQPDARPGLSIPPIFIYNSLTRSKTPFVPVDPSGKRVVWYCCGPTVYDAAHLGHARNYVANDVIRRILQDYFNYDVVFVQNVTDIIDRARQRYFFGEYRSQHLSIDDQVFKTSHEAVAYYIKETAGLPDGLDVRNFTELTLPFAFLYERSLLSDEEIILKNRLSVLSRATSMLDDMSRVVPTTDDDIENFYATLEPVLSEFLGSTLKETITEDMSHIFSDFAQYWELDFNGDLRRLNCLTPTITTRVSEFIPENISFVRGIMDNGFAYPIPGGTVYFDVEAFRSAGHCYPKLEPDNGNRADGNASSASESPASTESGPHATLPPGDDSDEILREKRLKKNQQDFALWKKSRAGEPSWDSPWGKGRPGWHIECSAMCSHVLGSKVDIHSGGIDLAFPHHDNELAQSEAYWSSRDEYGGQQWVNYFIHIGHLSISGSKMSKSLKNFISIRDALSNTGGWTARSFRIVCMFGGWKAGMELSAGAKQKAIIWETTVTNFFAHINALVAEGNVLASIIREPFREEERWLHDQLAKAQKSMYDALCDSFNTALALEILAELIKSTNTYLMEHKKTSATPNAYFSLNAVREVAKWVMRIVNVFGLAAPSDGEHFGWTVPNASSGEYPRSSADAAMPYVQVLSKFRDRLKMLAIANPDSAISADLLALSDSVRDEQLIPLGVSLEDRNTTIGEPALIKFADPEDLLSAREEKKRQVAEREVHKLAIKLEREAAERERIEKAKVAPTTMFRTDEFIEWDDDGIPLRSQDGAEITKSKRKTLRKAWERQKLMHEAWLSQNDA
ncbi:cysteinyl-tRNA synthetase [Rickenella mellea]|uniref:cysteine--tRNA ligase n=1 Tax=Rickenella mellea TaxID=50990 RepID=A0A4V3AZH1_9AGAM|nr:cysteinyl-tRNA synthetase [Rickenella mellea]